MLSPPDAGQFEYFLFGGILGNVDDLDMDRTSELRVQGYTQRQLGREQMTTPTALAVSHRILHGQTPYEELEFIDRPEYELTDTETLVIPFKYLKDKETGEAIMAEGNLELMSQDLDWDLDMLM
jgi:ribosome biogenesis SPOUT family RNA methylase Rps3|tara:strand:- start:119 stop:490 length:372 start_codon:yes stop_codon:yes gene_type:complete